MFLLSHEPDLLTVTCLAIASSCVIEPLKSLLWKESGSRLLLSHPCIALQFVSYILQCTLPGFSVSISGNCGVRQSPPVKFPGGAITP